MTNVPSPPFWRTQLPSLALTLGVLGYLWPWLSHPAAGLTLIGLDVGEWSKFLPQMQAGQLPNRDYFYLPPITLGLALVWLSVGRRGWRPWMLRGLGVLVSLLAVPMLEIIRFEEASQWRPRLMLIGLVMVMGAISPWLNQKVAAVGLLLVGLIGLLWPTWAAVALRPVMAEWVGGGVSLGLGVYANGLAHGALAAVGWANLRSMKYEV